MTTISTTSQDQYNHAAETLKALSHEWPRNHLITEELSFIKQPTFGSRIISLMTCCIYKPVTKAMYEAETKFNDTAKKIVSLMTTALSSEHKTDQTEELCSLVIDNINDYLDTQTQIAGTYLDFKKIKNQALDGKKQSDPQEIREEGEITSNELGTDDIFEDHQANISTESPKANKVVGNEDQSKVEPKLLSTKEFQAMADNAEEYHIVSLISKKPAKTVHKAEEFKVKTEKKSKNIKSEVLPREYKTRTKTGAIAVKVYKE